MMTKILVDYQVIHAKSSQRFYCIAEDGTEAFKNRSWVPKLLVSVENVSFNCTDVKGFNTFS